MARTRKYSGRPPADLTPVVTLTDTCPDCGEQESWLLFHRSQADRWGNFKLCAVRPACRKGNYWFSAAGGHFARSRDAGILYQKRRTLYEEVRGFLQESKGKTRPASAKPAVSDELAALL